MAKSKAKSKTHIMTGRKRPVKKSVKKTVGKKKLSKSLKRKVASKKVGKTSTKKAKRKPQEKTAWRVSPQYKNSVRNIWTFQKDGVTIGFSQTFRWSYIIVAQKPDLTKYDPDKGISIDELEYSDLETGHSSGDPNWVFPDDFPLGERERIEKHWDEYYDQGMREAGWTSDIEVYYFGPLLVEDVESEYPHNLG
jgi:hypothetical protein